jgi:hypothetical protein
MRRRRRILGGREGRHGESCFVLCFSTWYFFRTLSHIWAKTCLTNGILGIVGKVFPRGSHLAHLIKA